MNLTIRALIALATLTAVATADEPKACVSTVNMGALAPMLGRGVSIQPVFAGGGVKGWRFYNVRNAPQLMAHGIQDGTLMTHVCGVPAKDIAANQNLACCPADTSSGISLTFTTSEGDRVVRIQRP